jgi:hypothetical protein
MGGEDNDPPASPEGSVDVLPALDFEESFTPGGLETRPLEDIRGHPAEMPEGIPGDAAALVRSGLPAQGFFQVVERKPAVFPVDPKGQASQRLPGPQTSTPGEKPGEEAEDTE